MMQRPNGKSATGFVNGLAGTRQTSLTSATSAPRAERKCFSRSGCGCGARWARGTSTFVWSAAIERMQKEECGIRVLISLCRGQDSAIFFLVYCTFVQYIFLHTSRDGGCHVPFLYRSRAMSDSAMGRHGAFSWCELMTTDVQAAKQFYTNLLGWTTEEVPGMAYTVVKTGDVGIGGIMAIPSHAAGASPQWGIYITVDDVDATARKAQELGAKTLMPLTDIPNVGRFYTFQDPQGATISLITYRMEGAPS